MSFRASGRRLSLVREGWCEDEGVGWKCGPFPEAEPLGLDVGSKKLAALEVTRIGNDPIENNERAATNRMAALERIAIGPLEAQGSEEPELFDCARI